MQKLIGLVDCNNFFVSCERLFRPDLLNRPVAVLSSNDGCIVARSKEVKDIGIPMGVPYFKVKDIIKDNAVTLFSSNFALYRDVSHRVMQVLKEELHELEQYSIDEVFFTIPSNIDVLEVAEKVKSVIETKVGIPVSVGVASSKTQAKYATDIAKKTTEGVAFITPQSWTSLTPSIELSELWGVGQKSAARYREAGYVTVANLLNAEERRVKALFGVVGIKLLSELRGITVESVVDTQEHPQASIMSSRSFRESSTELTVLEDAVAYHVRHIAADLRAQKQRTKTLTVSIRPSRHSDFLLQGVSLQQVFDTPTNDVFLLLKTAQNLLHKAFRSNVPYKKVGVLVSGLQSEGITQQSLFGEVVNKQNKELMDVVDGINQRSGRELITIGNRYRASQWQARKDMQSPAYTTKWTDVALVRA